MHYTYQCDQLTLLYLSVPLSLYFNKLQNSSEIATYGLALRQYKSVMYLTLCLRDLELVSSSTSHCVIRKTMPRSGRKVRAACTLANSVLDSRQK